MRIFDGIADYFMPTVLSEQDYYPFGTFLKGKAALMETFMDIEYGGKSTGFCVYKSSHMKYQFSKNQTNISKFIVKFKLLES